MSVLVASAAAFFIGVSVTPLLRAWAHRHGALDIPNERSSHRMPTPRIGGAAIVCGIVAASIWQADSAMTVVLAGALATAASAGVDEWRPLPHALRLSLQLLVGLTAAILSGFLLTSLVLPFVEIHASEVLFPMTIFWIVGVVNAYNFMDGLNGIASIEGIVCGATMALLALKQGDHAGAVLAASVAGAAAGFLPWNLTGSIFMGDIGSATIGFIFALMALRLTSDGVSMVAAALPLAPFLIDTTVTLVRRALAGEHLFRAHRAHFYQRLHQLGWPHPAVSALWGGLAAGCGAIALAYDEWTDASRAAALLTVVAVHGILFAVIAVRAHALAGVSR